MMIAIKHVVQPEQIALRRTAFLQNGIDVHFKIAFRFARRRFGQIYGTLQPLFLACGRPIVHAGENFRLDFQYGLRAVKTQTHFVFIIHNVEQIIFHDSVHLHVVHDKRALFDLFMQKIKRFGLVIV